MASWRKQLRTFLVGRFSEGDSFRRFVRDHFDDEVVGQVKWSASLAEQSEALVGVLSERGLIETLWPALRAERTRFVAEIQDIERAWRASQSAPTSRTEPPSARGNARAKPSFENTAPGPMNFAGMTESTWNTIPSETRTQIERWFRAKNTGIAFATTSTIISTGCTIWGFYLSDLKHELQIYAYWRLAFVANVFIIVISCIAIVRLALSRFRIPQQKPVTTDKSTQRWEPLKATGNIRAGQSVQLLGSIWVSKLSVDFVLLVTVPNTLALAIFTPLVKYFIFGSKP